MEREVVEYDKRRRGKNEGEAAKVGQWGIVEWKGCRCIGMIRATKMMSMATQL